MRGITRIAALAAAVVLLATSSSRAVNILFLAGALPLSAADQAIVDRLTNVLGHTVTAQDDHIATPSDMATHDLLIVSSTVGSSVINNQWNSTGPVGSGGDGALFRNLNKPILNFENGLTDEIGFTIASAGFQGVYTNAGSSYPAAGTDIDILLPAHPLAAGLSGGWQDVFTVAGAPTTSHGSISAGGFGNRMNPDATIVSLFTLTATFGLPTDASNTAIVALEQGDTLTNAVDPDWDTIAANRRIGFFVDDTSFLQLSATGLELFDAAVGYAVAAVPEPSTFVLAGLGLVGVIAYRRRVRR